MIVFCEECGTRHKVPEGSVESGNTLRICEACNDPLRVSDVASSIAGPSQKPIRLLIVDDSGLIRTAVRRLFETDGQLQVVGEAANGREVLDLLPRLKPDVIMLDINMPEMNGLSTLKHIMIKQPTPTVIFSDLSRDGAAEIFDALRFGAIDFMLKPSQSKGDDVTEQERLILQKVKIAAGAKVDAIRLLRTSHQKKQDNPSGAIDPEGIVVLGVPEGGYGPLMEIILQLPPDLPAAYVVLLYATPAHVDAFAEYLTANSAIAVKRALDGEPIQGGACYLVSGSESATLHATAGRMAMRLSPSAFPERRDAVNKLMLSACEIMQNRTIGVVLSGKGRDGAQGSAEIRRVGGAVIMQDPQACLFQEMVRTTLRTGKSAHTCPDQEIASAIKTAFGYQTN